MLVTRVMEDLDLTREEAYRHIMKANDKGLVKIIKTLEPGPYGLLSVTITARALFKLSTSRATVHSSTKTVHERLIISSKFKEI